MVKEEENEKVTFSERWEEFKQGLMDKIAVIGEHPKFTSIPFRDYEKKFHDWLKDIARFAAVILGILWFFDWRVVKVPGLGTSAAIVVFGEMFLFIAMKKYKENIGDVVHSHPQVGISFRYSPGTIECDEDGDPVYKSPPGWQWLNKIYGICKFPRLVEHDAKMTFRIIEAEEPGKTEDEKKKKDDLIERAAKILNVDMKDVFETHVKITRESHFLMNYGNEEHETRIDFHEMIVYCPRTWIESVIYSEGHVWGGGFDYTHEQTSEIELTHLDHTVQTILGNVPFYAMTGCPYYQTPNHAVVKVDKAQEAAGTVDALTHYYLMVEKRAEAYKFKLNESESDDDTEIEQRVETELNDDIAEMRAMKKLDYASRIRDADEKEEAKAKVKKKSPWAAWAGWLVFGIVVFVVIIMFVSIL
jgi:hypothetical protein